MSRKGLKTGEGGKMRQNEPSPCLKILTLLLAGALTVCLVVTALYLTGTIGGSPQQSHSLEGERLFDSPIVEAEYIPPPKPEDLAVHYEGDLELPVEGATGYALLSLYTYADADYGAGYVSTLYPGQSFRIIQELGDWWQIDVEGVVSWVPHYLCMINLPDVIPSIVYENSNSSASVFRSSGKPIPNLTGLQLYNTYEFNERFQESAYQVPVLYDMSKKIYVAQQLALAQGNTLIIYEGFRPYEVQMLVFNNLTALINSDPEVWAGVNSPPWTIGWFIVQGVSNHQQGYAIDVSLGAVHATELRVSGSYLYTRITEYEEYAMPTPIHELSAASVSMAYPVSSLSPDAWYSVGPAASMNDAALALQSYCAESGLTPIASEWWHFNDLSLRARSSGANGDFYINKNYSISAVLEDG